MEEKLQTEEGLSLLELVKLLLSKIKILFVVVVLAAIMGGSYAIWNTVDVNYYGTSIEFYVNPEQPKDNVGENGGSQYGVYGAYGRHVMDNIVKLLGSQSFAEILMEGLDVETYKLDPIPSKMIIDSEGNEKLNQKYINLLNRVNKAVTFSYLESGADVTDANNLARSFIYVNINVLDKTGDRSEGGEPEGKRFAQALLDQVKKEVPIYVEDNMAVPTDYSGTNCQQITIIDKVELTNPNYTRNQAIKYGFIFGAAAGVVACVIIIIVDRSDKRLRDYETVMRSLNVPVLGVIPTIAVLAAESAKKQKGQKTVKKTDKEVK